MTYTEIASALGITKGRITQIRGSAPSAERGFFGVGPVAVGVPWRWQTTDRERPLIAAEDAKSGDLTGKLLADLGFTVSTFQVGPETEALPEGDVVLICGPISSPIASTYLADDPHLGFVVPMTVGTSRSSEAYAMAHPAMMTRRAALTSPTLLATGSEAAPSCTSLAFTRWDHSARSTT